MTKIKGLELNISSIKKSCYENKQLINNIFLTKSKDIREEEDNLSLNTVNSKQICENNIIQISDKFL